MERDRRLLLRDLYASPKRIRAAAAQVGLTQAEQDLLLREAGAIAFTDGRHAIGSARTMRLALSYARAFGAIVDALGKLAAQLQIPPQMLWDRIPGVTRQDVNRWKAAQAEGDSLAALTGLFLEGFRSGQVFADNIHGFHLLRR